MLCYSFSRIWGRMCLTVLWSLLSFLLKTSNKIDCIIFLVFADHCHLFASLLQLENGAGITAVQWLIKDQRGKMLDRHRTFKCEFSWCMILMFDSFCSRMYVGWPVREILNGAHPQINPNRILMAYGRSKSACRTLSAVWRSQVWGDGPPCQGSIPLYY